MDNGLGLPPIQKRTIRCLLEIHEYVVSDYLIWLLVGIILDINIFVAYSIEHGQQLILIIKVTT